MANEVMDISKHSKDLCCLNIFGLDYIPNKAFVLAKAPK
jgi:hypothetical protein